MKSIHLLYLLCGVVVFVGLPILVARLTAFNEFPVLHAVGWLAGALVCYPAAAAVSVSYKRERLPFAKYYAYMFGIAVLGMTVEGLLRR